MNQMSRAEPSESSRESRPGRVVGRYELLHRIASGGMATVYLGRVRGIAGFERLLAIKCCHPHLRHDKDFAAMFLDEARLAARIHHPNVVGTLDVGEDDSLYLVMEYIEGDRLGELVRVAGESSTKIPVDLALRIMIDALTGLHAAHELVDGAGAPLNLVHRDVSPQNILVGLDGVTRITDFGIAKAEQRATVTREGQIKGKVSYMAPEQLNGGEVDRRADVFTAGVVLWETLTGSRLFRTPSDAATMYLVLHGDIPRPSEHNAEVTPEIEAVVAKALERSPAQRYASAAAFADALESTGHKIATSRAVAAYIQGLLGPAIAARREAIRTGAGLDDGASTIGASEASGLRNARGQLATIASDSPSGAPGSTRSSSRGRVALIAVSLIGALVAGGLLVRWFGGTAPTPRAAAASAPSNAVAATPPPPIPAGLAGPVAPLPPASLQPTPIAAVEPEATGPAPLAAPSPLPGAASAARVRPGGTHPAANPAARHPGASAPQAATPTQPPPAPPSEFRAGAI